MIKQTTKTLLRKTITSILIVAVIGSGVLFTQNILRTPDQTYAATPPDSCFAFNAGTGTITDYYNNEGNNPANPACTRNVDIPGAIGGVPVIAIGFIAFSNNQLTGVTIPSSVTSIGTSAFISNQLTSLTIPVSVTNIGNEAFRLNQFTTITIPSTVTNIGSSAFADNQITTVTILNAAATMQHSSFVDNPITTMTIGVTTYSEQTPTTATECFAVSSGTATDYYQASPLIARDYGVLCGRNVAIPNSVTSIGNFAFSRNQLTDVTIPSTVTSIGSSAFSSNHLTSVSIPTGVTTIGSSAFGGNQLATVSIPSSVISIDFSAFAYNELTSVTIPSSITTIANGAFQYNQLTSVTIPPGVLTIEDYAFYRNHLTSVTIPSSVTSVGDYAFYANQLTSVTIPSSLTSIGPYAFALNQLTSVTIPSSVTSIGHGAFGAQSQWGGDLNDGFNGAPYFWSSDPSEVQDIYNGIWYVRLITDDPSNPNGLVNDVLYEDWWVGDDGNANGQNDPLGGHLINPASAELQYVNSTNASLQTSQTFTGLLNGNHLNNYMVTQGPSVPMPADPENPTPAEQLAIDQALSAYYRIGDSVTIDPPAIDGYITPPTQTFVLGAADNTFSYVYSSLSTGAPEPGSGRLAETGMDTIAIIFFSATSMILGAVIGLGQIKSCRLYR